VLRKGAWRFLEEYEVFLSDFFPGGEQKGEGGRGKVEERFVFRGWILSFACLGFGLGDSRFKI
jgi:hypothetical protein